MSIEEPHRQAEIADTLYDHAHALATSTREFPCRGDTYRLLGNLSVTVLALGQVCSQLGAFHAGAQDGIEYAGEDALGSGQSARGAAISLAEAHEALVAAGMAIDRAHAATSHIRWV